MSSQAPLHAPGEYPAPSPIWSGIKGRCPHCGKGHLFAGFIDVASACDVCGEDFSKADSGDGPVIFIIMLASLVVLGSMLVIDTLYSPPMWLQMLVWMPVMTALVLGLMRPFKGVLICLQFHHKAGQGQRQSGSPADGGKDHSE
jgi:uncharacterized protein (DUF983 family)